jgi:Pyruvate phosphate dikinase, AMP/ATP-binding domain
MNSGMRQTSTNRFSCFDSKLLAPEGEICTIGSGSLGGKAQGLAFIRQALILSLDSTEYPNISVDIPQLAVIGTDIFDAFMSQNHLEGIAHSNLPDDRLFHAFQKADMPFEVLGDLRALIEQVHTPIAVRSSSLLEDAIHKPFAGVYGTKMIPNREFDPDARFRQLVEAIKFVYASTFSKNAKSYCAAVGHRVEEEKMGVIIQKIIGKRSYNRFYPELSGVARSYNYYPLRPARPEEGIVNLALGLGKTIVDGGRSWTYSPAYPNIEPPFGSVKELMNETQTEFWAVNMGELQEYDPISEIEYLHLDNIVTAERDGSLRYLASTYNPQSGRLTPGIGFKGPRALTFAPLLVLQELPINQLVQKLLSICEEAFNTSVEIEFAMTFNPNQLGFLQVRSMVVPVDEVQIMDDELTGEDVFLASETVFGNGVVDNIKDIIYVKPDEFELRYSRNVVKELEKFNETMQAESEPYLLIVFGRLGTADPWLGIPVRWGQISGAKVIVEATKENIKVELSQGSHFFHNIINLNIQYFSIPHTNPYQVDWDWLTRQTVIEEGQFVRHVRLEHPLLVRVDGRTSKGVILKK